MRRALYRPTLGNDQLFAMLTICLVVANGAICGILSGPYNRYQARIVWLVPVAALVVEGACGLLARFRLTEGVREPTRARSSSAVAAHIPRPPAPTRAERR